MNFTDIFIRRPVFATVVNLIIFITGLIAYQQLALRQFPKTDASTISIQTDYMGASAELVESFITQRIENAISGIDSIDFIASTSQSGRSVINVNFKLNTDINQAMVDLQSKIASVLKKLPNGVSDPSIQKRDPDSAPIMIISFNDEKKSPEELTDYLNRTVVTQLSNASGVSEASVSGGRVFAMRLWLDPRLMSAHGITASDVNDALKSNNLQSQAGRIDRDKQVISVNANTSLSTAEAFNRLIIKHNDNQLVRLSNIGHAELGAVDTNTSFFINGKRGISVGISAKSDANPLDISRSVREILRHIEKNLDSGMTFSIAKDASTYIQSSIHEVQHTILEACIFVVLVIFLFTGAIRPVLIPAVTIPLSLIGVCTLMLAMGYTLNVLTLLAFVLAIGMVVDDAIVVLENIHRHIERGLAPLEAALTGAREIRFAVISMTLTLTAVYAPIGFSTGLTGALFREFAFTLALMIILSGFIALTLSPMMCSKVMRAKQDHPLSKKIEQYSNRLTQHYQQLLRKIFKAPSLVMIATLIILLCGCIFAVPLYQKSTLAPAEDQSSINGMVQGPVASNIQYMEKYTHQLANLLNKVPEITYNSITNGKRGDQSAADVAITLKPQEDRRRSVEQILKELNRKTQKIAGVRINMMNPSSLPGARGKYAVQLIITSTGSYEELARFADELVQEAEKNPGFLSLQSSLQFNNPEIQIEIDRNKANDLGIAMSDIANALNISLGSPNVTTFTQNGITFDVIPQLTDKERDNPEKMNDITVRAHSGKLVPLANLIQISNNVTPSTLEHFQQQRSSSINVVLNPGFSTKQAITALTAIVRHILPSNMGFDFTGEARQYIQEGSSMLMIFAFSLIFIYLVLSAQFESFRDSFIVLLTVPIALSGALGTLYFAGGSFNIYTGIGLITLIGLIAKHGILITEFANQLQLQGCSVTEAAIEAASIRLRPILMTTAAMVLSAVPLALASGAGAAARQQIGFVIAGGMTFGTLFTLLIVPSFYILIAKVKSNPSLPNTC